MLMMLLLLMLVMMMMMMITNVVRITGLCFGPGRAIWPTVSPRPTHFDRLGSARRRLLQLMLMMPMIVQQRCKGLGGFFANDD